MASKLFAQALKLLEHYPKIKKFEKLLNHHPELLGTVNQSGLKSTLLFYAVTSQNVAATTFLLNKKTHTEITGGQHHCTPLQLAFSQKNLELMQLLLDHGANPNVCDTKNRSLLLCAVIKRDAPSIRLLMQYQADPYKSIIGDQKHSLLKALDTKQYDLVEILLDTDPVAKTIYLLIKENKPLSEISNYLDKYGHELQQKTLEVFFLFCTNNKKFEIAKLLYTHFMTSSHFDAFTPPNKAQMFREPKVLHELTFPINLSEHRKNALSDAFFQVSSLLTNSPLCLELLQSLDANIAQTQSEININFSTILPGDGFFWKGVKWPSASQQTEKLTVNCHGLLRYLLRIQLTKHGIETQEMLNTFSNFVKANNANPLIISGALFKEQFFLGSALIHGLYTHYLQWYILSIALETGALNFKDGITLLDLLQASVEVTMKGTPIWRKLIDFDIPSLSHDYHSYFGSPFQLNATLLCTDALPYLRGYLLMTWYNSINKIQTLVREKFDLQIDYETILFGQLLTGAVYTRFNLGFTQEDIDEYYQHKSKTRVEFNKATGILVKKASDRFAHWQSSDLIARLGLFQQERRPLHKTPSSDHSSSSSNGCF